MEHGSVLRSEFGGGSRFSRFLRKVDPCISVRRPASGQADYRNGRDFYVCRGVERIFPGADIYPRPEPGDATAWVASLLYQSVPDAIPTVIRDVDRFDSADPHPLPPVATTIHRRSGTIGKKLCNFYRV